jgi:tetratricopeptide (TPR) repeat protein
LRAGAAGVQDPKPNDEDGTYRSIEQTIQNHQYSKAEAQLLELVKRQPQSAQAHFLLGVLYSEESEPRKARGFFLAALKLQPHSTAVLNNLGFNALALGEEPEAQSYFARALSIDPKDTDALFNLALTELNQKNYREAEEHLKRASIEKPKDLSILQGLLAAQAASGAKEEVTKTVDRILNLPPREPAFYIRLAQPLLDGGLYAGALRILEQAAMHSPGSAEVAYSLARAYYISGDPQQARQVAERALAQQDSAPLRDLLGAIDEQLRLYDKAVSEYRTAVRLDPAKETYYFDLAHEFLIHYNFDLATEIFETAVNRFPASEKLRLGLAVAYFAQLRYDKAVPALKGAIEIEPKSPLAYFFLGKAFVLLSDERDLFNGAWVDLDFKRYSELRPNDPIPYYVRAVRLSRQGLPDYRQDEALKLLRKALELEPGFAEAYLELGKIYFKNKQYQNAIDAYQKAVDHNPALAEAYYGLALAYARSGNTAKANEASAMAQKRQEEIHKYVASREKEIKSFVYTLK